MKYKVEFWGATNAYELEDRNNNLYHAIVNFDEKMNPWDCDISTYPESKISKQKEKDIIEAIIKYEKGNLLVPLKYKIKFLGAQRTYELEDRNNDLYIANIYFDKKMNIENYIINTEAGKKVSKQKGKEIIEAIIKY
ncbi:unnamed protein product, partial [marine sediment metagenome]